MFNLGQFIEGSRGESTGAIKELLDDDLRDSHGIKQPLANMEREIGLANIGGMQYTNLPN